jgi:dipeptidyl aminopeptidase/acylaminoacyl peptidase
MGYMRPQDDVVRIFDSPSPPLALPSPDGSRILLVEREPHPPLALLARPFLRLAGIRVDPQTGCQRVTARIASLRVLTVDGASEVTLDLPADRSFGVPAWSPDGSRLALLRHVELGRELWIADAATGEARVVTGLRVTDILSGGGPMAGQPSPMLRWTADGGLLVLAIPTDHPWPVLPELPAGPRTDETSGKRSQMATFQDLLAGEEDADLFERFATSRLVRVDPETGGVTELGAPGLIHRFEPSPDGSHLLVELLQRPFSHRVPWPFFARRGEIRDAAGAHVATLADLPVADEVPRHGVPTGPRSLRWQANAGASLICFEALDGGDPTATVPHRDRLLRWTPPFASFDEVMRTRHRAVDRRWLAEPGRLLLTEWDRDRRWRTVWLVDLAAPEDRRVLFDLSVNDAYHDPGSPVHRTPPSGHRLLRQEGDAIFLAGMGAAEQGARPFLDRLELGSGRTERLFQSAPDAYERFVCFAAAGGRIVTERQSRSEPPHLRLVDLAGGGQETVLTRVDDPHPDLTSATKRLIRYRRADGVPLNGMLHLPPGWRPGGPRLPVLLWAYPLDYSDPDTAGQVRGSEQTFSRLEGASPLWLLLRGWAVLSCSMPVVGDPETMNDTFVDQTVSSAEAAIDTLDEMGIVDRRRVVVSGHSYGAFMTATLLAHSRLFAAGIARSGAYNRTLTPFGFQTERRSYWEAAEVYHQVSPFTYANRIETPLLLIHGAEDGNSGTYPIQSERLFQAIQGNGGTARLVVLPFEDHAYRARESVLHVIAETLEWVDRHAAANQGEVSAAG